MPPLTLRFTHQEMTLRQGIVDIPLTLRNVGKKSVLLTGWFAPHPEGMNNAAIYLRPVGDAKEWTKCPDAYLRSRSPTQGDLRLDAGQAKTFPVNIILELPPGEYEAKALLSSHKNIAVSSIRIRVTPRKLPADRRK
ncbi:MAG: hypothetical protein K8S55_12700 [Phycisphaerae bacterium]|nr:hypothetical protein [Phycisphaerae bacterium]